MKSSKCTFYLRVVRDRSVYQWINIHIMQPDTTRLPSEPICLHWCKSQYRMMSSTQCVAGRKKISHCCSLISRFAIEWFGYQFQRRNKMQIETNKNPDWHQSHFYHPPSRPIYEYRRRMRSVGCCGDCRQHQAGRFTTTSCIRRVDLLIGNKTRELQLVWHYQATTATVQTHFVLCKPSRLGSRYTVHRCQHSDYICMCIFVSGILILHAHTTIHT